MFVIWIQEIQKIFLLDWQQNKLQIKFKWSDQLANGVRVTEDKAV